MATKENKQFRKMFIYDFNLNHTNLVDTFMSHHTYMYKNRRIVQSVPLQLGLKALFVRLSQNESEIYRNRAMPQL